MRKVITYREQTQFDPKYGLFFWENAISSGADNNVALTNDEQGQERDPGDRHQHVSVSRVQGDGATG